MRIRVQDVGILCDGSASPGPAHNAAFPNLLRCPDGSILAAHRVGSRKDSADGTQRLWRSCDEGAKWSPLVFPFARTPAGNVGEFRIVALSDIGGGAAAMLITWIDHLDDVSPLGNAKTEGLMPIHIGWTVSTDNGTTWSQPLREIDVSPLIQPAGNGPIVRLANGDLLVAFETYKEWDDPSPWSARSAMAVSSDEGRTWRSQILAADPSHRLSYFDQHVHQLPDGSLLSIMWVDDRQNPGASTIQRMHSRDGGRTWSAPAPTGLSGQLSTLMPLPDGRLLMFYVVRHSDSAIRIALTSPDGTEWRTQPDWTLYAHAANDLSRTQGKDFGDYLAGMQKWTFGWPSGVVLRDGSILAAYYRGAGDRCSVHLARVTID
jgi:hypothetical protein